jgi:hypothetical protein
VARFTPPKQRDGPIFEQIDEAISKLVEVIFHNPGQPSSEAAVKVMNTSAKTSTTR